MPALEKLLRTIIGLPAVLTLWPITFAFGLFIFVIQAILAAGWWIIDGRFDAWTFDEREEEKKRLSWATRIIVLPYQFMRHVWKS